MYLRPLDVTRFSEMFEASTFSISRFVLCASVGLKCPTFSIHINDFKYLMKK